MLVSDRTRFGCAIAIVWAIMPPIETPHDVRRLEPEVVEQPEGVVGHVRQGVRRPHALPGEGPDQRAAGDPARTRLERPASRLSKRMT